MIKHPQDMLCWFVYIWHSLEFVTWTVWLIESELKWCKHSILFLMVKELYLFVQWFWDIWVLYVCVTRGEQSEYKSALIYLQIKNVHMIATLLWYLNRSLYTWDKCKNMFYIFPILYIFMEKINKISDGKCIYVYVLFLCVRWRESVKTL